jgi:hypothetical protein
VQSQRGLSADVQVGDTTAIPRIQIFRGNKKKNNGTRINLCAMKTVNKLSGISYSHGVITQGSTLLFFMVPDFMEDNCKNWFLIYRTQIKYPLFN